MLVCVRCPSYQCKSFTCCKLIQLVILMTITVLFGLATVALALPFFSSGLPNKSLRLLLKNSQKPSDPHLVIVTGAANSVHFYVLNRNKTRFSLSPNQMISLILMSIFPNPSDREIQYSDVLDQIIPGQENINPRVGGNDDDQRQEEDLTVIESVVDVRPVVRAENLLMIALLLIRNLCKCDVFRKWHFLVYNDNWVNCVNCIF